MGKRTVLLLVFISGLAILAFYYFQRERDNREAPPAATGEPKPQIPQTPQTAVIDGFFKDLSSGGRGTNYLCGGRSTKTPIEVKTWTIEREMEQEKGKYIVKVNYKKGGDQQTTNWYVSVIEKPEAAGQYCIDLFFEKGK
jgi:hypothetical protein